MSAHLTYTGVTYVYFIEKQFHMKLCLSTAYYNCDTWFILHLISVYYDLCISWLFQYVSLATQTLLGL